VWDTQTGRILTAPFQHDGIIWSARFSPDGENRPSGVIRRSNANCSGVACSSGSMTTICAARFSNASSSRLQRCEVWSFFTCTGVVRPAHRVTRAKGPAHTSLGQRPRSRVPKYNPSANGAAQFPKSLSGGYRFRILAANCSAEFASRIKAWAEFDERSGFD